MRTKSKALFEVGGFVAQAKYTAFANTVENAYTALLERVFYHEVGGVFTVPANPTQAVVDAALSGFARVLRFKLHHASPVERHAYVAATYSGRKLAVYQNAVAKLDRRGLLASDSFISTFLKWEKILVQAKRAVPRVIQPRGPAYNVELGRYLHPIEHLVYHSIDQVFGHPTVMKGLNSSEQGRCFNEAWRDFQRPVALCIDASRFDQHIRRALLTFEHRVYDWIFSGDVYLRQLLRRQLRTRGFMRTGGTLFKYEVEGGRCSGDMNTAMGNIIIACAGVYGWLESAGLLGRCRVLDAGDDCVVLGEKEAIIAAAPTLQPWFEANMGLIMKVEPLVEVLEQVSFCQTQPVYDGVSWRMVRDPRVSLSKDATVIDAKYVGKNLKAYLQSIGDCGLSLTGGLPIVQEYYLAMGAGKAEVSQPVHVDDDGSGFRMLARRMHEKYRPVSDTARVSFWRAFGIPPGLQVELEKQFRDAVDPVPAAVPVHGEVDRVDLGVGVACCN